jgi:TolB-like protein
LPRRGYRLIADIEPLGPAPPAPPDRSMARLALSLVVVLGSIAIFWFGPASRVAERRAEQDRAREEAANRLASPAGRAAGVIIAERPLRVAVLALEMPDDSARGSRLQRLLEDLVVDFTDVGSDDLGVVGPVTTGAWVDSGRPQSEIGAELGVDYVLSASVSGGEQGTFAQLIRIPDGARLFATRFPEGTDLEAIRTTVASGTLTAIEQDSERPLR